jgi:RNA polymerase sigma factor (TIGR02999 family)
VAQPPATEITQLLAAARADDHQAMDSVFARVYGELRRLAHRQLRGQSGDATLSTTALVHEAYLRLVGAESTPQDRHHFFALAARAMRQIVLDRARRGRRAKRGSGARPLAIDEDQLAAPARADDVVALDRALAALERYDERQGRIVEWRFFGGLSEEEIGEALGITARSVRREWRKARAFLYRELYADAGA